MTILILVFVLHLKELRDNITEREYLLDFTCTSCEHIAYNSQGTRMAGKLSGNRHSTWFQQRNSNSLHRVTCKTSVLEVLAYRL